MFNELPYGIGLKIISTSLGNQNGIGIGLDFGFYKKIMEYDLGVVIKNFPASGMMWSNGYIEGTGLSAEFGLHRSFFVLCFYFLNIFLRKNIGITFYNIFLYCLFI